MKATWVGSPNYSPGRGGNRIDHITLHIMAGYLAGTDSTFQITFPPERRVSATYGIGRDGTIHQYVRESDTPWSDSNALSNMTGISIEHEGGLAQQTPMPAAEIEASARLCADISRRYGLGKLWHNGVEGNVYLHREIPGSTHTTCPDLAPNSLPFQRVIDRANELLGYNKPKPTGKEPEVITDKDIEKIAQKVWETKVHGTQARDRLLGIDNAANGVLKVVREIRTRLFGVTTDGKPDKPNEFNWLVDRVYRLADFFFNKKALDNIGKTQTDAEETEDDKEGAQ
mgnify:CR=1 FL=1